MKEMRGMLYGVGTGPGDPELMTIKAVRILEKADVIAVPGNKVKESIAYQIARKAVPQIEQKQLVAIPMPMTTDQDILQKSHKMGAQILMDYLSQGLTVAFLTLGDISVYSTFYYIQQQVEQAGFLCELISGIPSFCAAAAKAKIPLTTWDERLVIVPAVHQQEIATYDQKDTIVFMKAGHKLKEIKQYFSHTDRQVIMIENCGTKEEKIYDDLNTIPDTAGYLTLVIVK